MAGIFINYRRDDAAGVAGRLYDHLVRGFPRASIFIDVDAMKPGRDFVEQIDTAIARCDAVLAVIGERWLNAADEEGRRRLDNPRDYVRVELAAALKREIPIVPVLVDGAQMPTEKDLPDELKSLVRRQALELRNSRFAADSDAIVHALRQALPPNGSKWLWLAVITGIVMLGAALAAHPQWNVASLLEEKLASYLPWKEKEKVVKGETNPPAVFPPAGTSKPTAVRLGGIKTLSVELGDAYDHVKAIYPDAADGGSGDLQMPLDGLSLFFDRNSKRLRTIIAEAPFIGVIHGVHIGDSADDVVASLGQPFSISKDHPSRPSKDGTMISSERTTYFYNKGDYIIRYDFDHLSKVVTITEIWERW